MYCVTLRMCILYLGEVTTNRCEPAASCLACRLYNASAASLAAQREGSMPVWFPPRKVSRAVLVVSEVCQLNLAPSGLLLSFNFDQHNNSEIYSPAQQLRLGAEAM